MDYKVLISEKIAEIVDLDAKTIEDKIEIPPKSDMGDFAFPCFILSKVMKKAPNLIAVDLAEKINKDNLEKVEALGPYLNFFLDKSAFGKQVLEGVLQAGEEYGNSNFGKGGNVVIDFSSPNIAKPFHVGHLFSTAIGNALYRMYNSQGYNSIGINHLGDWGTQFGKLISAYKRWVDEEALQKDAIKELLRIYVKFHDEADIDPSLEDEGRAYFKKLEDGDEEAVVLWKKFRESSLKEFQKVYDRLGVKFDSYNGEAFYNDKMDVVVQELKDKNLLTESNGAQVVNLDEYNMPPCIILKSDGATIYATRDLAAALYRKKKYNFVKSLYVVGGPQALHFKQVFKTLELAGHEWAKDCTHVSFGLVKFADRKLSTRKGEVIFLDDLLKESVNKTLEIINEKNPNLKNKEEVAEKVGIGAMVFTYLKNSRDKDIVFDWNDMLSFEGETGPYVQYTYARAKSILRKFGTVEGEVNYGLLTSKEEFELIKTLDGLNDAILNGIERNEPSVVTRYAIDVAKAFNKVYNALPIGTAEEDVKKARLKLVEATAIVIKKALYLIGLETVEEM
ncbi:arginine--tRNA ligase [Clostridium bornimense]|uniref:arginine--tRNA ligase n=1 Tax=Clostridium bornimense TaxID=1216932 RepID=UPI001C124FCB|nr:arginine--tRNA ligase [Clostridium bornimense]MBU5315013.1 arginine--tRNA ligase [Clostridium bornimense]